MSTLGDDKDFSPTLNENVFSNETKSVLHTVDKATNFPSARWLAEMYGKKNKFSLADYKNCRTYMHQS